MFLQLKFKQLLVRNKVDVVAILNMAAIHLTMVLTEAELLIMLLQWKFKQLLAWNKESVVNLRILYFQSWWPSWMEFGSIRITSNEKNPRTIPVRFSWNFQSCFWK